MAVIRAYACNLDEGDLDPKVERFYFGPALTAQTFSQLLECLEPVERQRIRRLHRLHDQKLSLFGQLLARYYLLTLLNELLGPTRQVRWDQICLERTPHGKPFLALPSSINTLLNLQFNISHHNAFVAVAVSLQDEIGVDVVCVEPHPNPARFLASLAPQFTCKEWTQIRTSSDLTTQLELLYKFWGLKESLVKATGTGLQLDLQHIEFTLSPTALQPGVFNVASEEIQCTVRQQPCAFYFCLCSLDARHCAAIAYRHAHPLAFEFCHVQPPTLIHNVLSCL